MHDNFFQLLFSPEGFYDGMIEYFRIGRLLHAANKRLRGAEAVAAMNDRNFRCKTRQIQRILHCGVAAAHNADLFAAEEGAVAGCAIGNAATTQTFLLRQPQRAWCCAHAQHHGARVNALSSCDCISFGIRQVQFRDFIITDFQPKLLRLFGHSHGKLRPADSIRESGVVFNPIGCRRRKTVFHTERRKAPRASGKFRR